MMPSFATRPLIRAAFLSLMVLPAAKAGAQSEPIRLSIDAWVAEIDALPDWKASYQNLSVQGDTATVTGLAFTGEPAPGTSLEVGTLTVTGFSEPGDGGFAAGSIAIDKVTFSTPHGSMVIEANDIALANLFFPGLPDIAFDPQKPFSSMMRTYAVAARTTLDGGSIANVVVTQKVGEEQSRVTYADVEIGRMADGVLTTLNTGALQMLSPAPEGLVHFNVERLESRDTDLATFVRVFDPDQYAGGVGDMVWHPVFGFGAYHDVSITAPGGVVTIHELSMEDFKVRQPQRPFTDFLDTVLANPDLSPREMEDLSQKHALDLASAFGIGKLTLKGLDIAAEGIDRFHLGEITLDDMSIDGLAQFAFTDLDFIIGSEGSGSVERFAFGDLKLPNIEALRAAVAAGSRGGPQPNPLSLLPTLGYVELTGLTFAEIGQLPASLDRFRLTMEGHIGPIPTVVKIESTGQRAPLSLIDDRNVRAAATSLGYDEIVADSGIEIAWREEDSSLVINNYHVRIQDVGSVRMDIALAGLTRAMIKDPTLLEGAVDKLTFTGATIHVEDDSLLQRIIEMQARQMNVTPERFREQIAGAIPFTLMILRNSAFQTQIGPALQTFIKNGGGLTITAKPSAPVPFSQLIETATSSPQNLPNILELTIVND